MRVTNLLIAAAIATASPAIAQSVQSGIDAWQMADYAKAVEIWRPLAEAGDADARFNLGQAYRLGRGVPVNLAAAQTWLGRAAQSGHVDAQTTLGLLLFDSGNREDGLRWLGSAAEKGEARAMLIYGTALYNGDGVKRNPVLAYAYVSRAAAQGLAPAKATLSEMDKVIPLAQRKQGVRVAMAKASPAKPAARATPKAAAVMKSPVASTPRLTAQLASGWRVQLGAFGQRSAAEALFRKRAASGPLAGRSAFYIPVGSMTRLQVGPFESRVAAQKACASLSAQGQACFPVQAR